MRLVIEQFCGDQAVDKSKKQGSHCKYRDQVGHAGMWDKPQPHYNKLPGYVRKRCKDT